MSDNLFTSPQFVPVRFQKGLMGFVSVVYNNSLSLSSIAVKTKDDGTIYLLCPSKKKDEKNIQYYHPINSETYNQLVDTVMPLILDYIRKTKGDPK